MQPDESYLKGRGQRDTLRTHPGLPGAGPEAASPEQPTACRAGRSTGLHTGGKGFAALQVCAPGHPCELRENCTEALGTSGLPVKAFTETESPTREGCLAKVSLKFSGTPRKRTREPPPLPAPPKGRAART